MSFVFLDLAFLVSNASTAKTKQNETKQNGRGTTDINVFFLVDFASVQMRHTTLGNTT